jgi:signal peptidase I
MISSSPYRRLIENAVLFLCIILFLRVIAVEPFGVPTGSMAPTLIGNHKALLCPRCQIPIRIGEPHPRHQAYPSANCPNCGLADLPVNEGVDMPGDRLLVDKNIYRLRDPRRWEVAVFICPVDRSKPYVKRVIGLPNEEVIIQDGDIWIDGHLSRKTLAQARQCLIPIFDSRFAPPDGWGHRWLEEGTLPKIGEPHPPHPEWFQTQGNQVKIDARGSEGPRLMSYWQVPLDQSAPDVIRDDFEYNGHSSPQQNYAVHDFLVEFDVEVLSDGPGLIVCSMADGADRATVNLTAGNGEQAAHSLKVQNEADPHSVTRSTFKKGKKHHVEMAIVDRRVSVAVDRKEYFTVDLPEHSQRNDITAPFDLGAWGVDATFTNIKLYRDIYYRASGQNATTSPLKLGPDEYFMLGDNSVNSDDGRSWQIPGVPQRNFLGKPFLLHQPTRPGTLTLAGRTYPIRTIDWGRIRWLR